MVLADVGFWQFFFLLLIFLPLVMVWVFALVDIFRRDDMGGVAKALWLVVIILLPFLGTLIYLLLRPAGATKEERVAIDEASREFVQRYSSPTAADQLRTLSELHDAGKISDEEFAAGKAKVLAAG
jgi:hypothetical protein